MKYETTEYGTIGQFYGVKREDFFLGDWNPQNMVIARQWLRLPFQQIPRFGTNAMIGLEEIGQFDEYYQDAWDNAWKKRGLNERKI
jgi:hypothetical protein